MEENKVDETVRAATFSWSPSKLKSEELKSLPKLPTNKEGASQRGTAIRPGTSEVQDPRFPVTVTTTPYDLPKKMTPFNSNFLSLSNQDLKNENETLENINQTDNITTELQDPSTDSPARETISQKRTSSFSVHDFDDDVLFPGFEFEPEHSEKNIYSVHDSWNNLAQDENGQTRNPLDFMDEETRQEEKKRILQKYYKYGTLSTFKGRAEMKAFKAKLEAKNQINRVLGEVASKEAELDNLENLLVETRENKVQYMADMKKILEEMQGIVDQTFPAGAGRHLFKGLDNPQSLPTSASFPTDPQLMLNKRYRMLRDQYKQHESYITKATQLIPELQSSLSHVRRDLSELHAKEWELRPLQKQIAESDLQEFAELQIVAQERAIIAERKQQAAQRHLEKVQQEHEQKKQEQVMRKRQKEADFAELNARTQERYYGTMKKLQEEKEQARQDIEETTRRKMKELEKLSEHIRKQREAQQKQQQKQQQIDSNEAKIINMDTKSEKREEKSIKILMKIIEEEHKRTNSKYHPIPKIEQSMSLSDPHPVLLSEETNTNNDVTEEQNDTKNITQTTKTTTGGVQEKHVAIQFSASLSGPRRFHDQLDMIDGMPLEQLEAPKTRRHLPPPQIKNYKPQNKRITDLPHGAAPFLAAPDQFMFEDFEPDQTYSQTATIMNISGRINSFRLLPVPIEISSFFEIHFNPPGKLSAGKGTNITIVFRPPPGFKKDIPLTAIYFEADIGDKFYIFVGCHTKKCIPQIASAGGENAKVVRFHSKTKKHAQTTRDMDVYRLVGTISNSKAKPVAAQIDESHYELDFGSMYVGGRKSLYLDLCNMGAMPVEFGVRSIMNKSSASQDQNHEDGSFEDPNSSSASTHESSFSVRNQTNCLKGYDSQLLHFDFHPPFYTTPKPELGGKDLFKQKKSTNSGTFVQHVFEVQFHDPAIAPIRVSCKAIVIESPIFLDRENVDFKICTLDTSYQDKVTIRNHHTIALKFWLEHQRPDGSVCRIENEEVQDDRLGVIQVSPPMAFIQPFEPFQIWLTIKPSKNVLKTKNASFSVPMFVKYVEDGTGITRSIPFQLSGTITQHEVVLTAEDGSSTLNFGYCSTQEMKELPVVISNLSLLPHALRFIKTSPALSLLPMSEIVTPDLVIFLEPGQSQTYLARFEPPKQGHYSMSILVQNTWNRTFELSCLGFGVQPLAVFDHSRLSFPSCAYGSHANMRVKICRKEIEAAIQNSHDSVQVQDSSLDNVEFEFGAPIVMSLVETVKHHDVDLPALLSASTSDASQEPVSSKMNQYSSIPGNIVTVEHKLTDLDPQLVQIWPSQGLLKPGETASIEVTVCPPIKTMKSQVNVIKSGTSTAEAETPASNIEKGLEPLTKLKTSGTLGKVASKPNQKESPSRVSGKAISAAPTVATNLNSVSSSSSSIPNAIAQKLPSELLVPSEINEMPPDCHLSCSDSFTDKLASFQAPLLNILVPCYLKNSVSEDRRLRALIDGISVHSTNSKQDTATSLWQQHGDFHFTSNLIYLELMVPIVPVDIVLIDPQERKRNFGQTPIGERVVRSLVLRNTSDQEVNIQVHGLNPYGPFFLAKALRPIPPLETATIVLSFEPDAVMKFCSTLELMTNTTKVFVKLAGEGVSPSIEIDPPSKSLAMGDICVGENITKTFKIRNSSVIPVECSLDFANDGDMVLITGESHPSHGTDNFFDVPVFSISPLRVTIPPSSCQEITVKFSPTRESDCFFDHIIIRYWGQKTPCVLQVAGRGWKHTPVLIGYEPHPSTYRESQCIQPTNVEVERAYQKLEGENRMSNQSLEDDLLKANDDLVAKLIRVAPHRDVRFGIITLPWKQIYTHDGNKVFWEIQPGEFVLANLRPANMKIDIGKKSPNLDFSIEPFEGSFKFNDTFNEYVICRPFDPLQNGTSIKFDLETLKGSLELGSSKSIKITPKNTTKDFWENMSRTWEKHGVISNSDVNEKRSTSSTPSLDALSSSRPCYAEAVFKIVLKGGVRLVEPKGVIPPQEPRIWYLKVRTESIS